jgi:hypothetical protein
MNAVQAWLSRLPTPNPLAVGILQERERPPVIKDPIVEVKILSPIFVGGTAREVGSKAFMATSDAYMLAGAIPPAVAFVK